MHLHAHILQLMPKSSPERTQTSWRDSSTKKTDEGRLSLCYVHGISEDIDHLWIRVSKIDGPLMLGSVKTDSEGSLELAYVGHSR